MTMFEMIDAMEPIIPEREMNAMHALAYRIWTKDNPEAHKEIVRRHNAKRSTKKEDRHERVGAGDR